MDAEDVSTLTLVVAACTLLITFWQGYLARQHNRLIVRPQLSWNRIWTETAAGTEIEFRLESTGAGPAVITDRYFTHAETRFAPSTGIDDEVAQFIEHVMGQHAEHVLVQHGTPNRRLTMLPGSSFVIARLQFPAARRPDMEALIHRLQLGFVAEYQSLYGQRFTLRV